MIGWVLRLFGNGPAHESPKVAPALESDATPEATEVRHKATLKRADRLLARVEDYRAADAADKARREHR